MAHTKPGLVHNPLLQVVMMGFSMGGYVAAALAATHPDLVAGVVMGACAHDTHTTTWKMVGYMSQAVYAVCSPKTKSQVSYQCRTHCREAGHLAKTWAQCWVQHRQSNA